MDNMGFREIGISEMAREIEGLANVDQIAPEVLEAAAPILEKALKRQVRAEANKGYATGDLEGSIKANKPKKNQYGYFVSVTATGKDRKGVRNNEKLAYLNNGTSKQQARPVIAKARQQAEGECLRAMQEKFNEVAK